MFFTLYTGVLLRTIVLIFFRSNSGGRRTGGGTNGLARGRGGGGTLIINIIVVSDVLSPVELLQTDDNCNEVSQTSVPMPEGLQSWLKGDKWNNSGQVLIGKNDHL